MKKRTFILAVVLAVFMLMLTSCMPAKDPEDGKPGNNGGEEPTDTLSGELTDIYNRLVAESGKEMGMTFDEAANNENCQSYLGLNHEQFKEYVEEALVSQAAISTHAHLVAIIKCSDSAAAGTVKALVKDNFKPDRWVCVFPQECFVVDSGSYVLLVASRSEIAEALKNAFETITDGKTGTVEVFYTHNSQL